MMDSAASPKIILGMALAASDGPLRDNPDLQDEMLDVCAAYGVKDLDTSYIYSGTEELLGELGAPKQFRIHTKAPGFVPGCLSRQSIIDGITKSLEALGTESVDTYFLHSPDPVTPIQETLDTIQSLYLQNKFQHFGISNFLPSEVQNIHSYCLSKNYVLPTVYQGSYNPLARHAEAKLIPLLRKLGIAFYAYSPLAGGFLVKSAESIKSHTGGEGRWKKGIVSGNMYHLLYNKPRMIEALAEWEDVARMEGTTKANLAYRWAMQSLDGGKGDGLVIGASSVQQLEQTLDGVEEGPLSEKALRMIDEIWERVQDDAPFDNYHGQMSN